ncbi:MAG: hypothetical protein SGARI_005516, partial [Bacillariaceae sp.]
MNPMHSFDNDNGSGIPMFSKNGTALSNAERQKIADKRGVCLNCGVKLCDVKMFKRTPLTNDDVYQGICIKCNGGSSSVPSNILQEWQSRNAPPAPVSKQTPGQSSGRFRNVANSVRLANVVTGGSSAAMLPARANTSPSALTTPTAEVTVAAAMQRQQPSRMPQHHQQHGASWNGGSPTAAARQASNSALPIPSGSSHRGGLGARNHSTGGRGVPLRLASDASNSSMASFSARSSATDMSMIHGGGVGVGGTSLRSVSENNQDSATSQIALASQPSG